MSKEKAVSKDESTETNESSNIEHPACEMHKSKVKKIKNKVYEQELKKLQGELVALQEWAKATGQKICIIFEGRDGAGKGGAIKVLTERVSPRVFKTVALPVPTEREKTQMYMQRYIHHFPAAGEIVIFDRSWYNRAVVEPVMGYCTQQDCDTFLSQVSLFEKVMVNSGIILLKYWLEVNMDEQKKRMLGRINDPRKVWKLSVNDVKSYSKWYDYSKARDKMIAESDSSWAPWFVVNANDKKRARLNVLSHILSQIPYEKISTKPVKLPKRQDKGDYVEPNYFYRWVPEQF